MNTHKRTMRTPNSTLPVIAPTPANLIYTYTCINHRFQHPLLTFNFIEGTEAMACCALTMPLDARRFPSSVKWGRWSTYVPLSQKHSLKPPPPPFANKSHEANKNRRHNYAVLRMVHERSRPPTPTPTHTHTKNEHHTLSSTRVYQVPVPQTCMHGHTRARVRVRPTQYIAPCCAYSTRTSPITVSTACFDTLFASSTTALVLAFTVSIERLNQPYEQR